MLSHWAAVFLALATTAGTGGKEVTSLANGQLAAGRNFEIQTADHVFRGQMVDPATGECQMAVSTDGHAFGSSRTVYLLGATAGRQENQLFVVMREVRVGMRMELGLGDLEHRHRHITGEVTSIVLGD
jgi:hypothetical protein